MSEDAEYLEPITDVHRLRMILDAVIQQRDNVLDMLELQQEITCMLVSAADERQRVLDEAIAGWKRCLTGWERSNKLMLVLVLINALSLLLVLLAFNLYID